MITDDPDYARILFPTDLAPHAASGFATALRLAVGARAHLEVVHVHGPTQAPAWDALPHTRALLSQWGRIDADADVSALDALGLRVSLQAAPSLELTTPVLDRAARHRPDLLVLPTGARKGLDRLRVPSVAELVAQQTRLPALFLPDDARPLVDAATGEAEIRTVVVPLGLAEDARTALQGLHRLLRALGALPTVVVLVHVGTDASRPPLLLPDDEPFGSFDLDVRPHASVAEGLALAAKAHDADLVAIATRGKNSVYERLMGSVTQQLVRHAPCPVLSLPTT